MRQTASHENWRPRPASPSSAAGKPSRQYNFAVDVASPGPISLREHDSYQWCLLETKPPVTQAVKQVLAEYRATVGQ